MEIKYSKYQEDFFNEIKNSNKNIMLSASAGSGKSFCLVESLKFIPYEKKIIFCAFNKSIVEELQSKIKNSNVKISTLHSIGLEILRVNNYYDGKLNFKKFDEMYDDFINSKNNEYYDFLQKGKNANFFKWFIKNVLDKLKLNLIDENDTSKIKDLMTFYDINSDKYNIQLIKYSLQKLIEMSKLTFKYGIDFSDMIWLPVIENLKGKSYDVIIVDESQDLSLIQRKLIENIGKETSRYTFVGDKNQAINGFAGSNVTSIDEIVKEFDCKVLPLSICYRCPKTHIELAQKLVPSIEFYDKNKDGEIIRFFEYDLLHNINKEENNLIICRTNAPLVNICLTLIKANIKSYIKGGNLEKSIKKEIKDSKITIIDELEYYFLNRIEENEKKIEEVDVNLDNSIMGIDDSQTVDWEKRQAYLKKRNLFRIIDISYAIINLLKREDVNDLEDLNKLISLLFQESKDSVCCCSIHKSKGLESDNVYILYPHLLPHPILTGSLDWQKQQERNVEYVAKTRAKDKLYFIYKNEDE